MKGWTRACACGAAVTANPDDPMPGVLDHIRTEPHRSWSAAFRLVPLREIRPTVGPLTVDRLRELGLAPKAVA